MKLYKHKIQVLLNKSYLYIENNKIKSFLLILLFNFFLLFFFYLFTGNINYKEIIYSAIFRTLLFFIIYYLFINPKLLYSLSPSYAYLKINNEEYDKFLLKKTNLTKYANKCFILFILSILLTSFTQDTGILSITYLILLGSAITYCCIFLEQSYVLAYCNKNILVNKINKRFLRLNIKTPIYLQHTLLKRHFQTTNIQLTPIQVIGMNTLKLFQSPTIQICKSCIKGGGTIFIGSIGYGKVLNGFDYRTPGQNFLSMYAPGSKTNFGSISEFDFNIGAKLELTNPGCQKEFVNPETLMIDHKKLKDYILKTSDMDISISANKKGL